MAILKDRINVWLAAGGMGIAGFLHLWIVPEHWEHTPAHGIFFLFLGIVQLVWVIFLLKGNSLFVQKLGMILAASSILLWVLTITLPAPFEDSREEVDAIGIAVKLFELASVIGLVNMMRLTLGSKSRLIRVVVIQIILAFVIAVAAYTAGRASESLFPELREETQELHHY
ncbi:hypothetical protein EPN54_04320 [bacterium]|nr:MAG: hypothetical protein EPN54_04320 [bacterium]